MKMQDTEKLMAYADGELSPQEAQAVERLLREDPEAQRIVDRFRQTRAQLADDLNAWLDEPVPQHLIDTVRQHPGPSVAPPALTAPVPMPDSPVAQTAANDRRYWPSLATAASVALVVGLVAGQWWGGASGAGADPLTQALQTLPTGQVLRAGQSQVMPLASFQSADGKVCREFEHSAGGRQTHGIACLEGQQWISRFMLDQGPAGKTKEPPPAFATASGEVDAVSAMIEALRLGQALTPEEEERALRSGWAASR